MEEHKNLFLTPVKLVPTLFAGILCCLTAFAATLWGMTTTLEKRAADQDARIRVLENAIPKMEKQLDRVESKLDKVLEKQN